MRKEASLSILLIMIYYMAQSQFCISFISSTDDYPGAFCKINDGSVFSVNSVDNSSDKGFFTKLYKINTSGDTTLGISLHNTSYMFANSLLININSYILSVSTHKYSQTDNPFLNIMILDHSLNVLAEKEYSFECYNISFSKALVDDNQTIALFGSIQYNNTVERDLFFVRLTDVGDTLETKKYDFSSPQFLFDVTRKLNSQNYLLFVFGIPFPILNSPNGILEISNSFNIVNAYNMPGSLFLYNNCSSQGQSNYYISGKYHIPESNPRDDDVKIVICDTNFLSIDSVVLGAKDTIDYPAIGQNMIVSDSSIIIGFTKNANTNTTFSRDKSWLCLFYCDNSMDIKWKRFYGGDSYYILYNIDAASDGYYIIGQKYDWKTQDYEHDVIIIKTDENGLITSTGPGPSIQARDAIVYPNPGRERLTIERGPQIAGAKFVLNDMAGKTLIEKTLNHTTETLPTAHLPAGLYLWNITHKGKAVENGKWVKE